MAATCVVIGSGRLGLGMIFPTFRAASCDPVLLVGARPGRSRVTQEAEEILLRKQGYFLHFPSQREEAGPLRYLSPCKIRTRTHFKPASDRPVVLALSVGPSIDSSTAAYVQNLAATHLAATQDVFVIPCENRLARSYNEFLNNLRSAGCHIIWTVVDRMCFTREVTDHEWVYVSVEHASSWILRTPPSDPKIEEILREVFQDPPSNGVEFVPRISPYRARKARLVNGSHFAIALKMGCQKPDPKYHVTDHFVRYCQGITTMLLAIHGAYITSLLEDFGDTFSTRSELEAYADTLRSRLQWESDTAERILRRMTEDDLEEWIKSYFERVHEPLVRYDERQAKELAADLFEIVRRRDLGGEVLWWILQGMKEKDDLRQVKDVEPPEGS